jgi:hypothetical protein
MTTSRKSEPERVMELLVRHEERLNRKGWDQLPTFHMILADEWGRLRVGSNLMPEHWQYAERSFLMLHEAAEAMNAGLCPGLPEEWRGWVFCTESWGLPVDGKDVTRTEAEAVAGHRLIHEHPLRTEQRHVLARTADGGEFRLMRERGKSVLTDHVSDPFGAINQCLDELVAASAKIHRPLT